MQKQSIYTYLRTKMNRPSLTSVSWQTLELRQGALLLIGWAGTVISQCDNLKWLNVGWLMDDILPISKWVSCVCNQTGALLNALVQLCHISTPLAEKTWVQLFPRLWKILSDRQQHVSTSILQRAELTVGHFPLNIFHVDAAYDCCSFELDLCCGLSVDFLFYY